MREGIFDARFMVRERERERDEEFQGSSPSVQGQTMTIALSENQALMTPRARATEMS